MYTLIRTIDANFRLKLKDKGYANDPPLGDGWGHWVSLQPFKEYVKQYGWQVEVGVFGFGLSPTYLYLMQPNLCDSNLLAADHAAKKGTVFSASGVAGTLCGRHTLVSKNGLGDLQKGER